MPASASRRLVHLAKEHLVILGSLSKTYSMTGWRAGYALASKAIVANLSKLQSQQTSNATSIVQKAAIAALSGSQECVSQFAPSSSTCVTTCWRSWPKFRRHLHKPEARSTFTPTSVRSSARRREIATELATRLLHEHMWSRFPAKRSNRRAHPHLVPCDQAEHRRRHKAHEGIPRNLR